MHTLSTVITGTDWSVEYSHFVVVIVVVEEREEREEEMGEEERGEVETIVV